MTINLEDPLILLILFMLSLGGLYISTKVVVTAYLEAKLAFIRKLITKRIRSEENTNGKS